MSKTVDGLLGLAVGDAIGVPVEFASRNKLKENPVTGMREYGSHFVPMGTWSDDTSMTIAVMKAIVDCKGIDYDEIMGNFAKWLNEGEFTTDGNVFDVGGTCLNSITHWLRTKCDPRLAGEDGERKNGNGSLMRFLPVPIYCRAKGLGSDEIVSLCSDMSSLTHRHEISRLGCYIYTLYVMELLEHGDKRLAYDNIRNADYSTFSEESVKAYGRVLEGDISSLDEEKIESTGYVIYTLEAALWCLLNENDYEKTVLKAVNLGHDTDTVAAVAGSMAGIIYSIDGIPKLWQEVLLRKDDLVELAFEFDDAISTGKGD